MWMSTIIQNMPSDGKITATTKGDINMLTLPMSPCWVVGSTDWGALVAEGLGAGTACGTVCITMDPCGLMICCPGADTICRTLPKSTINVTIISIKNDILILTLIPHQMHARSLNVLIALCLTSLILFIMSREQIQQAIHTLEFITAQYMV